MQNYLQPRIGLIALLIYSLILLSGSLILQYGFGLEPCLLCYVDRTLVFLLVLVFFAAVIQRPGTVGIKIYLSLGFIFAGLGVASTTRHLWLIHHPLPNAGCSPSLSYLIETLAPLEVAQLILKGTPACSKVVGTFLGLSLPFWTLVGFLGVILLGLITFYLLKKERVAPATP